MKFSYFESPDTSTEIDIIRLNRAFLEQYAAAPSQPHRNKYQAIIWIKKGSGTHLIDDQLFEIEPHTFMLVSKGQVHAFNPGKETLGWAVRFADSFLNSAAYHSTCKYSLFSNITVNSVLRVEDKDRSMFEALMAQLQNEHEKENEYGKDTILQRLVEVLIIKLEQLKRRQFTQQFNVDHAAYLIFQQFNFELENHFNAVHDVSSYAERLNISSRKLSEILKLFVGKPASRVIQERLIVEAKRYLRYTGKSVKEIGFELGFSDPSYFSKVFKKVDGKAPRTFRADVQKVT